MGKFAINQSGEGNALPCRKAVLVIVPDFLFANGAYPLAFTRGRPTPYRKYPADNPSKTK
jgi:hypothetical protein